jgi:hypothetical protein
VGAQGTVIVDFGMGASSAEVLVTGQTGILAGSLVEAWIGYATQPNAGTFATYVPNNLEDDHVVQDIRVRAGHITPGTGFEIEVVSGDHLLFGQFIINWVWN